MVANIPELVLSLAGLVGVLFGVILFLAFVIETVVEAFFAPVFNFFPRLQKYKPAQMYVAIALGVTGAFLFQFDILYLVGSLLARLVGIENPIRITWFGILLTGVSTGMGSAYIHRFVSKIAPAKKPVLDEHDIQSYR